MIETKLAKELDRRKGALLVWFGVFTLWSLMQGGLRSDPVAALIATVLVGGYGAVHGVIFLLLLTLVRPKVTPGFGAVLGPAAVVIVWVVMSCLPTVFLSGAAALRRLDYSFLAQEIILGLLGGALSGVWLRRTQPSAAPVERR